MCELASKVFILGDFSDRRVGFGGRSLANVRVQCRFMIVVLFGDGRSPDGRILDPDNLYRRYFVPVLKKSGIRKIRLHDLRHTFGSLLIQSGASIVYVEDQMGHSSIQVTVDTYGHLIPGANVSYVDRLDQKPQKK
jgi:integrase